jgi:deoxyribose-phosphate aldolase
MATDARVNLERQTLAQYVDHTLLKPEATEEDVILLCAEAKSLGLFAVCVSPTFVQCAKKQLTASRVRVATVVGFPSGKHASAGTHLSA